MYRERLTRQPAMPIILSGGFKWLMPLAEISNRTTHIEIEHKAGT